MSKINKTQLKKLAARAWTECYNNEGWNKTYKIEFDGGNKDDIVYILNQLADDMNSRWDNSDYCCGVSYFPDDDNYEFYVVRNDPKTACYEYDDDDEETETICMGAEIIDDENPAPDDDLWCDIRVGLKESVGDREFWQYDHLVLALNWGNSLMDGRHAKTSDDDWELFTNKTSEYAGYSQENCYAIYKRLCKDRLKLIEV